jgi:hypothetical protein
LLGSMFTPRGEHTLPLRRIQGQTKDLHPKQLNFPLRTIFIPGG